MKLIDFSNAIEIAPEYNGSEKKKTMILNGKKYLVKFPDPNRSPKLEISYINNIFSEYIGTKVFEICGFNTQKVALGVYVKDGKRRYVCACEDFTDNNTKLIEFQKLENASLESNPFKKELNDIYQIAESGVYNIDIQNLKDNFWNMFIIDALIGNYDRHNGNWGFIKKENEDKLEFAPIFDCGSSLFSTYTDEEMNDCFKNNTKMQDCIKNTPSAIRENNSKIKYYEYILSLKNKDCNEALKRVYNKIDLNKIFALIDEIDIISDIRKNFYKKIIQSKYDVILTPAYKKLV